jgi:steroid 5-alpha reductase family enzyme
MELISNGYFVSKIIFGLLFWLWLLSLKIKNVSIVDIFWGMGFVVVAWGTHLFSGIYTERSVLLLILVSLWGGTIKRILGLAKLGKA